MIRRMLAGFVLLMLLPGLSIAEDVTQRIRPLTPAEWSPEVARLLGSTRGPVASMERKAKPSDDEPETLNILRTIAHHERLLGPFLEFATVLGQKGALSRRDSEILALRTSWNARSEFEWGHHVAYGLAAGLSPAEIDEIVVGPESRTWSEADRALLQAADQLFDTQQIADATWALLAKRYSEAQLVEIPFVVGQYTMLSMVANATGVQLESGYAKLPEAPR